MKTVAIIQARMGSNRLRGKSLMPIVRIPLLRRVIETARKLHFIDDIIIATTNLIEDDPIEAYSTYLGYKCYRGDSVNVLDRFVRASKDFDNQDTIVRITADNPLNHVRASKLLFEIHRSENMDYTCVKGLSHVVYEYIKVGALRKAFYNNDLSSYDKEHVTPYLRNNPHLFDIAMITPDVLGVNKELDVKLTIDEVSDRDFVEGMIKDLELDNCQEIEFGKIYNWVLNNTSIKS
ncbi:hypothetical protein GCM10009122_55970 [Fulvivirga kasyanovii]|uniref:Acylneuraminate cytidylyltransferase n=1 Tax=Fulvivirga kasyanovii TaxID=396812 RepID=A0ABW9RJC9_9BACT|nr:hypothetical protein [Fulvivirga kasyanovii]MTI23982.1 hypothetical protein [Fulvivirga kasyanovii]